MKVNVVKVRKRFRQLYRNCRNPVMKILNVTLVLSMLLSSITYNVYADEDKVEVANSAVLPHKDGSPLDDETHTDLEVNGSILKEKEDYGYKYPSSYDWEKAFKQSMLASQFCVPLSTDMYNIVASENGKEAFSDLYDEDNNAPYELNHRPIFMSKDERTPVATVKDILSAGADGNVKNFYVKYLDSVVHIPEKKNSKGKVIQEEEWISNFKFKQVYRSNTYTLLYYTMFAKHINMLERIESLANSEVSMDQYGNIVINGGKDGDSNRAMVVPNYINNCITQDSKFPLNTRILLSSITPNILPSVSSGAEVELDGKIIKEGVADVIKSKKNMGLFEVDYATEQYFDAYSIQSDNGYLWKKKLNVPKPVKQKLTLEYQVNDAYKKFSWCVPEVKGMYYFGFDSTIKNNILNVVKNNKSNEKYPLLDKDGYFAIMPKASTTLGTVSGGDVIETINIKNTNKGGSYKISRLNKSAVLAYKSKLNNNTELTYFSGTGGIWDAGQVSKSDFEMSGAICNSFIEGSQYPFLKDIAFYTKMKYVTTQTGSSGEEKLAKSSEDSSQDVNMIVKLTHTFLTKPGSSLVKIGTSVKSCKYNAIIKGVKENYLFHMNEIKNDPNFLKMLEKYIISLLLINVLNAIFQIWNMFRGDFEKVKNFIPNVIKGACMSVMPIVVFLLFIGVCNNFTDKIFKDTFIYWGATDVDLRNRISRDDSSLQKAVESAFRENTVKLTNSSDEGIQSSGLNYGIDKDTGKELSVELGDLLSSTSLVRGRENGTEADSIMANKERYKESLFYYFYDNFRYHIYNYYEEDRTTPEFKESWENPEGMVSSDNYFLDMVKDPYFLYGNTYDETTMGDFKPSKAHTPAKYRSLKAQDILGLNNLFSGVDISERPSVRTSINSSEWFKSLYESSGINLGFLGHKNTKNLLDFANYKNESILADYYLIEDYQPTDLEYKLFEVNQKIVKRLMVLQDYKGLCDETQLFMASVLAANEFDTLMNKKFRPEIKMYPEMFYSGGYGMDTVFRSIFYDVSKGANKTAFQDDLMTTIEESGGGSIVQSMVIACAYLSQFTGIMTYIGSAVFFILAIVVFILVYNLFKKFYNKAWLGLLVLSGSLLLTHVGFLFWVNAFCVPRSAIIRSNLFGSYAPSIKIILLIIALLVKCLAISAILIFSFKHVGDLGGEIIADTLSSTASKITGAFNNGKMKFNKNKSVNLDSDEVYMQGKNGSKTGEIFNRNTEEQEVRTARSRGEDSVKGQTMMFSGGKTSKKSNVILASAEGGGGLNSYEQSEEDALIQERMGTILRKEEAKENINNNNNIENNENIENNYSTNTGDNSRKEVKEFESYEDLAKKYSQPENKSKESKKETRAERRKRKDDKYYDDADVYQRDEQLDNIEMDNSFDESGNEEELDDIDEVIKRAKNSDYF